MIPGKCKAMVVIRMCAQALDNLVTACLNKDADKRPAAAELLKDPVLRHAHDSKWLAKRMSGLDRNSQRVSFKGGIAGPNSTSHSPTSPSTVRTRRLPLLAIILNDSLLPQI